MRILLRFGWLTGPQLAALAGLAVPGIGMPLMRMRRLDLVARLQIGAHPRVVVHALTPRGRRAAASDDAPPVNASTTLDHIDTVLAAADLAIMLEAAGEGRWRSWPEYRRWRAAHPQPRGRPWGDNAGTRPTGVLQTRDSQHVPVWAAVIPSGTSRLRRGVEAAYRMRDMAHGRVYALPEVCARLGRLDTPCTVIPWTPDRLANRPALLPGWAGPGAGRLTVAPAEPLRHPIGPSMLAVLTTLARFGHATPRQIHQHAGAGRGLSTVRESLGALERMALAQRSPGARHTAGELWSATPAGLAAAGFTSQAVGRVPVHAHHTISLADLAWDMETYTGGRWETEREIRREMFATGVGGVTRDAVAPPDGRLTLPDGRRVLIQLQITRGNAPEQRSSAWRQRHHGLGSEVWFVCARDVAPAYRRAIRRQDRSFIRVLEWTPRDPNDTPRPGHRIETHIGPGWAEAVAGKEPEQPPAQRMHAAPGEDGS